VVLWCLAKLCTDLFGSKIGFYGNLVHANVVYMNLMYVDVVSALVY
jgi:hypothetical protein